MVLERYADKVRLVHHDLPIDALHPQARKVHEAARCTLTDSIGCCDRAMLPFDSVATASAAAESRRFTCRPRHGLGAFAFPSISCRSLQVVFQLRIVMLW